MKRNHKLFVIFLMCLFFSGCDEKKYIKINVIEKHMWIDLMPKVNGNSKSFVFLNFEFKNVSNYDLTVDSLNFIAQSKSKKTKYFFNNVELSEKFPLSINSNVNTQFTLKAETDALKIHENITNQNFEGFIVLFFSKEKKSVKEVFSIGELILEKVY